MDAVLVECDEVGRVKYEHGEWTTPTVQERRAIIHAAESERDSLTELLEMLGPPGGGIKTG